MRSVEKLQRFLGLCQGLGLGVQFCGDYSDILAGQARLVINYADYDYISLLNSLDAEVKKEFTGQLTSLSPPETDELYPTALTVNVGADSLLISLVYNPVLRSVFGNNPGLNPKAKPFSVSELDPKAKPFSVSELDPKAKPFSVFELDPKAKPFSVSELDPKAKPFFVSELNPSAPAFQPAPRSAVSLLNPSAAAYSPPSAVKSVMAADKPRPSVALAPAVASLLAQFTQQPPAAPAAVALAPAVQALFAASAELSDEPAKDLRRSSPRASAPVSSSPASCNPAQQCLGLGVEFGLPTIREEPLPNGVRRILARPPRGLFPKQEKKALRLPPGFGPKLPAEITQFMRMLGLLGPHQVMIRVVPGLNRYRLRLDARWLSDSVFLAKFERELMQHFPTASLVESYAERSVHQLNAAQRGRLIAVRLGPWQLELTTKLASDFTIERIVGDSAGEIYFTHRKAASDFTRRVLNTVNAGQAISPLPLLKIFSYLQQGFGMSADLRVKVKTECTRLASLPSKQTLRAELGEQFAAFARELDRMFALALVKHKNWPSFLQFCGHVPAIMLEWVTAARKSRIQKQYSVSDERICRVFGR